MPLTKLSEFSEFLSNNDHTLQEILNHMVRVVLSSLEISTAIYFQANESNEFFITGQSGISKAAQTELIPSYSLSDNYPAADAIRYGKIIWLPHTLKSLTQYPVLRNFPELISNRTLILVPVFTSGTPVAALALFSKIELERTEEVESFFKAMSTVFSLYFYRLVLASPHEPNVTKNSDLKTSDAEGSELSERQSVILRLISENRTNSSISAFLGYSESTIRQEIMRIFAKLGCSTRSQAAVIYRSFNKD